MRRVASVAGALLAVLALAGCGVFSALYENRPSDGGVPTAEAIVELESTTGVASARYWTQDWYSPGEGGLFESSGKNLYLELEIDDDHHIADLPEFLDAAFASLWAINDGWSPKGRHFLVITGGADLDAAWTEAAQEVFGDTRILRAEREANLYLRSDPALELGARALVGLDGQTLFERYGEWPAASLVDLAPFLASGPFEQIDPPAIDQVLLRPLYSDPGCWILTFERETDLATGEVYRGDVSATLSVDGEPLPRQTADTDSSRIVFCADLPETGETLTATVSAAAAPGFAAVELDEVDTRWRT